MYMYVRVYIYMTFPVSIHQLSVIATVSTVWLLRGQLQYTRACRYLSGMLIDPPLVYAQVWPSGVIRLVSF
jgi:hypothetical protein